MYPLVMRSLGIFFAKYAQQQDRKNADIVHNAIEACKQIANLEEALGTGRSGLQENIDFLRAFCNSQEAEETRDESPENLILGRMTGLDDELIKLQTSLENLRTQVSLDLREDYKNLEDREAGAQRVYAYHLPAAVEACPERESLIGLQGSLQELKEQSLELDLSCFKVLQVCLDGVHGLPEDLADFSA